MPSPNSKDVYQYIHRGWKFPTLGFALLLHERVTTEAGNDVSVLNEGALSSAVNAPVEGVSNQDVYHRLFEKAAAVGFRVAKNHAFVDGNKRTALLLVETILNVNGYYLKWSEDASTLTFSLVGASYLNQHGLLHALLLGCELDPTANMP